MIDTASIETSTQYKIHAFARVGKHNPRTVMLGSELICYFNDEDKARKMVQQLNDFLSGAFAEINS